MWLLGHQTFNLRSMDSKSNVSFFYGDSVPFLAHGSKTNSTITMTPLVTRNAMTTTPSLIIMVSGDIISMHRLHISTMLGVLTNFIGDQPTVHVTEVGLVYVIVGAFCLTMSFRYAGIAIVWACQWWYIKEESRSSGEQGLQEDGGPA